MVLLFWVARLSEPEEPRNHDDGQHGERQDEDNEYPHGRLTQPPGHLGQHPDRAGKIFLGGRHQDPLSGTPPDACRLAVSAAIL